MHLVSGTIPDAQGFGYRNKAGQKDPQPPEEFEHQKNNLAHRLPFDASMETTILKSKKIDQHTVHKK